MLFAMADLNIEQTRSHSELEQWILNPKGEAQVKSTAKTPHMAPRKRVKQETEREEAALHWKFDIPNVYNLKYQISDNLEVPFLIEKG